MCGAPVRVSAFGARTFLVFYHKKNGSESTVELTWVEYHVAEPIDIGV
jgi:hypothetical protein